MADQYHPSGLTGQAFRDKIRPTDEPPLIEADHGKVEHAYPTSVRGWLVMVPKRHCEAIRGLSPPELAEFGKLTGLCGQAIQAVLGARKEYMCRPASATSTVIWRPG